MDGGQDACCLYFFKIALSSRPDLGSHGSSAWYVGWEPFDLGAERTAESLIFLLPRPRTLDQAHNLTTTVYY